jgi:hypothetical protein
MDGVGVTQAEARVGIDGYRGASRRRWRNGGRKSAPQTGTGHRGGRSLVPMAGLAIRNPNQIKGGTGICYHDGGASPTPPRVGSTQTSSQSKSLLSRSNQIKAATGTCHHGDGDTTATLGIGGRANQGLATATGHRGPASLNPTALANPPGGTVSLPNGFTPPSLEGLDKFIKAVNATEAAQGASAARVALSRCMRRPASTAPAG